ncbi:RNA polymerase sigma factor SigF [Nocardia lijiangensis]|uniref:RNA polymerase sigma factor SigF n=1 Tax=Nocardia lijiangensis TaxID=299618 RepID=UPI0008311EFE|nr:RNA polymerase sigma factor SigF [Nocardia lijiangensis]
MTKSTATSPAVLEPVCVDGPSAADGYEHLEPWLGRLAALCAGDRQRARLREQIVACGLPLAEHIARRFAHRGEAFEDLLQTARMGLVEAVDRFDPTRGTSFLAFAVPTIIGEVRRHFRDRAWAVQVERGVKETHTKIGPATENLAQRLGRLPTARELAAELDIELTEVTKAMTASNCYTTNSLEAALREDDLEGLPTLTDSLGREEPCYELLEDAMAVRPLIAALPARDRQILIWRYYRSMTQDQIAQRLGLSQMQISRILSRTLTRLREQALTEPQPL